MRKVICSLVFAVVTFTIASAQIKKQTFGLVNKENIRVNGVNVGLFNLPNEKKNNFTNGLKIELIGVGIGVPLIPRSPIFEHDSIWNLANKEPITERVNGISIAASGTVTGGVVNGIVGGVVGNIIYRVNGISAASLNVVQGSNGIMVAPHFNMAFKANGAQLAIFGNSAYYLRGIQISAMNHSENATGLQIGLFNKSENLKGIQLGLWNVNQKRKLPIINWNFKRTKA